MATIPLISVNDLKTRLGYRDETPDTLTLYASLVEAATEQLQTFCRRTFQYSASHTDTFNTKPNTSIKYDITGSDAYCYGSGKYVSSKAFRVHLSALPVTANTIVVNIDYARDFDSDTELTVNDDYVYDSDGRVLYMLVAVTKGIQNMKVTYTGGYATEGTGDDEKLSGINSDLFMAALLQAEFMYRKMSGKDVGYAFKMSAKGDKQVKYANTFMLTNESMQLASPYRKPNWVRSIA